MQVRLFPDPYKNIAVAILRDAARDLDSPVMETEQAARDFLTSDLATRLMRIVGLNRYTVLLWFGLADGLDDELAKI